MLFAALLAFVGCQRTRAPESFIPADAVAVLSIPRMDQGMAAFKALGERFSDLPTVRKALAKLTGETLKETGIDLDRPDSIRISGLDAQKGLHAFLPATADRGCLIAGVRDAEAVDTFVRTLLRRLDDKAKDFRAVRARGLSLTEVIEEGQTKAEVAFVQNGKSLLLCIAEKTVDVADYLAGVAQAAPEQGLSRRTDFQAARASLGSTQLWAYVEAGAARKWIIDSKGGEFSASFKKEVLALDGRDSLSAGLDVSGQAVALRLFVHSTVERAAADRKLGSGQGPAPNFIQFLPKSGAIFLVKVSMNLPIVVEELMEQGSGVVGKTQVEQGLAAVNRKIGLDLQKDVVALLAGRFLVGADKPGFGLDEARKASDPMTVVPKLPVYLLAQVNDRGKAAGLLSTIERRLRQFGIPVEVAGTTEPVYTVSPEGRPLLSFGLRGDVLVISTAEHFVKLLASSHVEASERGEIGSDQVAALLHTGDGEVMFLDLVQTAALLHAVTLLNPDKDIDEVLPLLDKLRDLALLSQWHDDGSLVELQVRLR
jgi:hypothetical protein